MHACSGCAVASDSGWPAAAGPAKMTIWAIIFHQHPLEVAWGGTCTIPIKSFLDPVSRYIAGTHLHRGLLRLVCIKGTDQSILSPAPSKKIRYTEIDAFHPPSWADGACGVRRERGSCSSLSFSCQLQGHFYRIYRIFEKNCMKHLS